MKKNCNKLLIIAILCAIVSFVLCYFSAKSYELDFAITNNAVNETLDMGSDNPGAGWYLIFAGGAGFALDFAYGITVLFFALLVPAIILSAIIFFQCIARLIQIGKYRKWKYIIGKIVTCISVTLQLMLCLLLTCLLASNLPLNKILLLITLILNVFCIILFIRKLADAKTIYIENQNNIEKIK